MPPAGAFKCLRRAKGLAPLQSRYCLGCVPIAVMCLGARWLIFKAAARRRDVRKVRGSGRCLEDQATVNIAMPATNEIYWITDNDTFLGLAGGREVANWFGFVPSFHDATLEKLELAGGQASIVLRAFRMTDAIDENGYFVLDRHVLVEIHLSGVTGVSLTGDATSSIAGLGIRRITSRFGEWITCGGPQPGDFEVCWDTNVGLEGTLYAREVSFKLHDALALNVS